MNARADRFPLFDGLRAIAALSVLMFHVSFGGFNGLPSPLRELSGHLDVGVAIFFVISGFLLYRPFVRARLREEPMPRVGAYAWRRFLRIVPAYWVALTVITIWLGTEGVFTASGIPTYYGFLQAYSNDTFAGGIGQAWTLCVEVGFYALLPLWALLMRSRPLRSLKPLAAEAGGLVLLFVASSVYLALALFVVAPNPASPFVRSLPGLLHQFALGMGLAVLSVWLETAQPRPRFVGALARVPSAPWVVAFAALAGAAALQGNAPGDQVAKGTWLAQHELHSLTALAAVVPGVLAAVATASERPGLAGRVLGSRVLLYVGLWSYGIYLWHVAVVDELAKPVGDLMPAGAGWQIAGLAVATLAVSCAIAAASYYLVERPALSLKSRFPLGTPAAHGEAVTEPAPATPPTTAASGEASR